MGELAGIVRSRSPAEVEAQIAAVLTRNKGAAESKCQGWQASTADRAACIEVQKLHAEAARAAQRDKLAADLAMVEVALSTAGPARAADPAATAIVSYGRAVDLGLDPEAVTQWLLLVPVIALEIGSAFAVLLAGGGSRAGHSPRSSVPTSAAVGRQMAADAANDAGPNEVALKPVAAVPSAYPAAIVAAAVPAMAPAGHVSSSSEAVGGGAPAGEYVTVMPPAQPEARLLAVLRDGAGRWTGSQRKLAGRIGLTKSGANVLLSRMARRGQITVKTRPRKGTVVRLAA
ncbi:MAG: hypothetical protein ACKVP7_26480 [Hyphomicrobiaceae bacterium]